ncbi:MAG: ribosomal protein S18-alanine N-acetyltransferase [Hyphomicrobiales bacterium]
MISLERAELCHAEALAALHASSFEKNWSAKTFSELLSNPSNVTLFARDGDTLLGFILVQIVEDELEIITIATHPDAQRKGIATALLNHLKKAIPNLSKMFLEVDELNTRAIQFYEQIGFKRTGYRNNYYRHKDGTRSDALLMALALADRA